MVHEGVRRVQRRLTDEAPIRDKTMMRLVTSALLLCLVWSGALAESVASPKERLLLFRTEHGARERCPDDRIVWANTTSHTLHLRGDNHFAHTHGGFACESEARARGYRGPTIHT
jgi:hypothetical protein